MGSYMIWKLEFLNKESKDWFDKKFKKKYELREIHGHFDINIEGFDEANFYYDAGYLGYAEAQTIVEECKNHGVRSFKQLPLCDTKFQKVY